MSAVFNFTFVPWFRSVAPYIHMHRGKTFVVGIAGEAIAAGGSELTTIRRAIRNERKLRIRYIGKDGVKTSRTIWPFAIGFFDRVRVVAAWCELRQGFRHFRTDRVASLMLTEKRYPRRRQALLKQWREAEGIPPA